MENKNDERFEETEDFVWRYDVTGKPYKKCGCESRYLVNGVFEKQFMFEAVNCFIKRYPDFKGKGRIVLSKYEKYGKGDTRSTKVFEPIGTFTTIDRLKKFFVDEAFEEELLD